MKIVCLLGEPGAGKSTLMKRLIDELDVNLRYFDAVDLVPFHTNSDRKIMVLGKYEDGEVFGGTDKMSMQVQAYAVEFLDNLDKNTLFKDVEVILFEGDRLANSKFLEHFSEDHQLYVIYLQTSEKTRKQRFLERNSDQNETWLAGRNTKVQNIVKNFLLMDYIEKWDNNNLEDQSKIVARVEGIVYDRD